ncbi:hypothetical protein RM697_07205 [Ichthyenterobacterium sp. W332]|uniref:Glycine dehydrogenase n=1 Tax=Microcosmobacter mediterraneus TaxID=3075607 RepID=A0ABU2YJS8_9FLAO|nr:hypothetical protein [Ichthyenterobacterium sp. W332]MDT0558427.1 hypothetical protein [Ichthyenterobacterium sp. W332]
MKKRFLFITCEEAMHICNKSQYNESSKWEKFKLNIRLSWCKVTRAYFKRNTKLTNIVNKANTECLKTEERKTMEQEFQKELAKH